MCLQLPYDGVDDDDDDDLDIIGIVTLDLIHVLWGVKLYFISFGGRSIMHSRGSSPVLINKEFIKDLINAMAIK